MTILYQYPPQAPIAPPVGGATEAKQDAQIALATTLNTQVSKEAKQDTQITLATTLNAKDFATSVKQDTAQASLGSIDTKLTSQATAAKQDLLLAELQLKADLTETQPVSLASVPLPTGAATAANQATELAFLNQISDDVAATLLITSTSANQTAQSTLFGAVTETAPASDTASSGLNGRLQRIAQRITSLIALLPASLGQKTMANGLAVTIASDQSSIPVSPTVATVAGTITNAQIAVGTSAVRCTVTGSAPNAARKRLSIKPSINNSGRIFIGSSGVTTANGLEIVGPDRLDFEFDSGDYYMISDTAAQSVDVLEKV